MHRREKDNVTWLEFDLLAKIPGLKHGVFLRQGGYSEGVHKSLNVSFDVDDNPAYVKANIEKIKEIMSISDLVWSKQCHGNCILEVTKQLFDTASSCDALYTQVSGRGLMIKHADCQAAIIYDTVKHVVANVHSGWRGSVQNIYRDVVQSMERSFGSKPSDLLVCISPSLGPNSAEFIHYKQELPSEFLAFQVKESYFDFWEISRAQLEACGVLSHHIEIAQIDTYLNPHDYFSFRRDRATGRHGTIASLC